MHHRFGALLTVLAAIPIASTASAQDLPAVVPAPADSVVSTVGGVILHFVDGRSRAEAGDGEFNPFGIDAEALLFTLGSFFITADFSGEPIHEGEVAIFPQFVTPRGGAFEASEATPPVIPFAVMKGGECHGGFVTGFPIPSDVYAVDMTGQLCHAATVDDIVLGYYQASAPAQPEQEPGASGETPAFDPAYPRDIDLDVAVWAAYRAAYGIATGNADSRFAINGDYEPLRSAIEAALQAEGLGLISVTIGAAPAGDEVDAFVCAPAGSTEVRAILSDGDTALTLVAASAARMSSYSYDPAVSADLDIKPAGDCPGTDRTGRVGTLNEP